MSSVTESNLEVKLLGGLNGFKSGIMTASFVIAFSNAIILSSGKTVRAMFTHYADCGAIKSAVVSWIPGQDFAHHRSLFDTLTTQLRLT